MRIGRYILLCIALIASGALEMAYSQCVDRYSYSDKVGVPIVFEFRSGESRASWIYDSLRPRLQVPTRGEYKADTAVVRDGRLEATFCVYASHVPPQNSKVYFLLGAKKLEASVRPIINWRDTEFFKERQVRLREGTMPTIMFLNQPDPDWVVVRQATWFMNSQGYPRLEVELFNFASRTHPGVNLAFEFTSAGQGKCLVANPSFSMVPVSIRVDKGKVWVATGDPQSSELIIRQADVREDECSFNSFSAELGPTGPIEGKGTLRIRYSFEQKSAPRMNSLSARKSNDLTVNDLYSFDDRKLIVKGDLVFPNYVVVENLRGKQ